MIKKKKYLPSDIYISNDCIQKCSSESLETLNQDHDTVTVVGSKVSVSKNRYKKKKRKSKKKDNNIISADSTIPETHDYIQTSSLIDPSEIPSKDICTSASVKCSSKILANHKKKNLYM